MIIGDIKAYNGYLLGDVNYNLDIDDIIKSTQSDIDDIEKIKGDDNNE